MKKKSILSVLLCPFIMHSFAQPVHKFTGMSIVTDSASVITNKKIPANQSLSTMEVIKSVTSTTEEDDLDEKELNELEANVIKAKIALGFKNVYTITSSKSVVSKGKVVVAKVEESRNLASTTNYEAPSLTIGGRATNKNRMDFKQAVLSDDEKKLYKIGGIQVINIDDLETDSIHVSPTVPPSFVGGVEALQTFFAQKLKLPNNVKSADVKGRVFVKFLVRKDGKLDKVHLLEGLHDDCNAEAIRVIKMMPAWIPASNRGEAVSAYYILPVSFGIKK